MDGVISKKLQKFVPDTYFYVATDFYNSWH